MIGVWGDGNLGYITSLLLKKMLPDSKIYIFGVTENKLSDFTFADGTYCVNEIPADMQIDHAFECVGGGAASKAINQIIDYIHPAAAAAAEVTTKVCCSYMKSIRK